MSISERLTVSWKNDPTTLPQFSYRLSVFADRAGKGKPVVLKETKKAHGRTETLDASLLDLASKTYYLHIKCTDILDGVSETTVVVVGKGAAK